MESSSKKQQSTNLNSNKKQKLHSRASHLGIVPNDELSNSCENKQSGARVCAEKSLNNLSPINSGQKQIPNNVLIQGHIHSTSTNNSQSFSDNKSSGIDFVKKMLA